MLHWLQLTLSLVSCVLWGFQKVPVAIAAYNVATYRTFFSEANQKLQCLAAKVAAGLKLQQQHWRTLFQVQPVKITLSTTVDSLETIPGDSLQTFHCGSL